MFCIFYKYHYKVKYSYKHIQYILNTKTKLFLFKETFNNNSFIYIKVKIYNEFKKIGQKIFNKIKTSNNYKCIYG